jgi:hypothetical protein
MCNATCAVNLSVIQEARQLLTSPTASAPLLRKTYSGRHGCMCGCLGNWSTSEVAAKRLRTRVLRMFANQEIVEAFVELNRDGGLEYVVVETETRTYGFYNRD